MLLDGVDVNDQNSTEAHIVREPEGLDQHALMRETIGYCHDVLGSLDAFLDVRADHWMRDFRSAAEVCEIVQEE